MTDVLRDKLQIEDEVARKYNRAMKFRATWDKYLAWVTDPSSDAGFPFLEGTTPEKRFRLLHMVAYANFTTDLENGFIEYGIITTSKDGEETLEPKFHLTFDRQEQLAGGPEINEQHNAIQVHMSALKSLLKLLTKPISSPFSPV